MPWDKDQVTLQFQLPKDLKEHIRRLAKQDKRSMAAECRYLLEKGIERRERLQAMEDSTKHQGGSFGA